MTSPPFGQPNRMPPSARKLPNDRTNNVAGGLFALVGVVATIFVIRRVFR